MTKRYVTNAKFETFTNVGYITNYTFFILFWAMLDLEFSFIKNE